MPQQVEQEMALLECTACSASFSLGKWGGIWRFGCMSCTKGPMWGHPDLSKLFDLFFEAWNAEKAYERPVV